MAVQTRHFQIIAGQVYYQNADVILCRCVPTHEQKAVLQEAHAGPSGGHFASKATAWKVLAAGLWWLIDFVTPSSMCNFVTLVSKWVSQVHVLACHINQFSH